MHQPFIIQHLFQVSSLEDVSQERLEAFVEAYPSYGIGHYLLSCKLQAEGSERFMPETQRTCLYFSNPLWLQWLLQNSGGMADTQPMEAPAAWVAETVATETQVAAGPVETGRPEEPPVAADHVEAVPQVEANHVEAVPHVEPAAVEAASAEAPSAAPFIGEPIAPGIGEPNAEGTVENVVTMAEEAFTTPESLTTAEIVNITAGEGENLTALSLEEPSAADELLRSIEEAKGLRESLQKLNEEAAAGTVIAGESLPAETEPVEAAQEPVPFEAAREPATFETAPEPATFEAAPAVEREPHEPAAPQEEPAVAEPAAPHEDPIHDEEAAFVLDETEEKAAAEPPAAEPLAPEPPKPAPTVTQDFLFEPYHTIDYFASQGIKLKLDENPEDKLGKQLKSFTDWLKTMRRLPQKDREVVPDRVMEEAVQTSAAHSIQGKDVLTETMAEVLAKQGMREKARAVYEKLSLLNPDKRAYFADKIEQLNIP